MGAMVLLAGIALRNAATASDRGAEFIFILLGCLLLLIAWGMYRWPDL